jgi:exodeoxyribonuclease VII small subunit
MTDETYTFEQTRVRLEGILVEVRKKDTSLEQSLELLEEGVRLLNQCNELIDQTAWRPSGEAPESSASATEAEMGTAAPETAFDAEGADVQDPASAAENEAVDVSDEPVDAAAAEVPKAEELPDDERD